MQVFRIHLKSSLAVQNFRRLPSQSKSTNAKELLECIKSVHLEISFTSVPSEQLIPKEFLRQDTYFSGSLNFHMMISKCIKHLKIMTDKAIICLENKKKTRSRFRGFVQIWCHFCVFKYTLISEGWWTTRTMDNSHNGEKKKYGVSEK